MGIAKCPIFIFNKFLFIQYLWKNNCRSLKAGSSLFVTKRNISANIYVPFACSSMLVLLFTIHLHAHLSGNEVRKHQPYLYKGYFENLTGTIAMFSETISAANLKFPKICWVLAKFLFLWPFRQSVFLKISSHFGWATLGEF